MIQLIRLFVFALIGILFASLAGAETPLVNHGDSWRYRKGTNAVQADWKTAADGGLDATWLTGNGGIGYASNTPETTNCLTLLTDMLNSYTTLYMRRTFSVGSVIGATNHLKLTMDWDDGFIVWLDGNFLTNALSPGAPAEPAFNTVATALHESSNGDATKQPAVTYDLGLVGSRLAVGTHVLAIMGLNQAVGSTDFIMIPDLAYGPPPLPVTNTWYASNSPVVIATNVTVPSGATLVIQAGVTVQFGTNNGLVVADGGCLLAEGTSNAPIHFTKYAGSVSNWGSISIGGSVGSVESRIAYATFDFNERNTGVPCIGVNAGTVFLDHLTFGNTNAPYIHVDGASFTISDCYFPASSTAGFEQCHGTGGIKSGGHGLVLRNFWGKGYGYNDIFDFTGGNRNLGQPIVQFYNNVLMGGDDDGFDLDGTDAWVEGNIFLHFHKNNGTPDSSSGVSGGNTGADTSEITVVRNIFFDCDQASDAKQTNFYTFLNNTFVHQSHAGGIDFTGAVVVLADAGTVEGRGMYLEGNIAFDIEALTRSNVTSVVTFSNNLLPVAYAGPGGGNVIATPIFKHVPTLAETFFTNWASAQIMWDWLSLQTNSPGRGTGPNGKDMGAVVPAGVGLSGVPSGVTTQTTASITVGFNRKGSAIPTGGFPLGSGYTHYQWRLDTNLIWSAETPIGTAILLSNLANGPHHIEVIGKNDAGFYQNDASLGANGGITVSATWTVGAADTDGDGIPDAWEIAYGLDPNNAADAAFDPDLDGMTNLQEYLAGTNPTNASSRLALTLTPRPADSIAFQFSAVSNKTYAVQYRNALTVGTWLPLTTFTAVPTNRTLTVTNAPGNPTRFYQVVTP